MQDKKIRIINYLVQKNKGIPSKIISNKMSSVFGNYGATFDSSDCVYNIITEYLLPEKEANRFSDAKKKLIKLVMNRL